MLPRFTRPPALKRKYRRPAVRLTLRPDTGGFVCCKSKKAPPALGGVSGALEVVRVGATSGSLRLCRESERPRFSPRPFLLFRRCY